MRFHSCLPVLGMLASAALGQGGAAILSLVLPPPGGEGFSILEAGGPFADGAGSAFHHPALLADLHRQTGSQAHFVFAREKLAISGPPLSYLGLAAVLPGLKDGADLGIGFFRNHLDWGETSETDLEGNILRTGPAYETVLGGGAALRLGPPVSLGLTAKYFESRLAPSEAYTLQGWAVDAGLLVNPRFATAAGWGGPWCEAMPAFALSVLNLGPDVQYPASSSDDPIPRTLSASVGLQVRVVELLEVQAAVVRDQEIHHRAGWSEEPIWNTGFSVGLLGFRLSRGWMDDEGGRREWTRAGKAIEVDLHRLHRLYRRVATGAWSVSPATLDGGYPLPRLGAGDLSYRANPRVVLGWRSVDTGGDTDFEVEDSFFFGVSL